MLLWIFVRLWMQRHLHYFFLTCVCSKSCQILGAFFLLSSHRLCILAGLLILLCLLQVAGRDCLPQRCLPIWHELLRDDCPGLLKPSQVQLKQHQYHQLITYYHVKFANLPYGVCFMLLLGINAPVEASQSSVAFGSVVPQSTGALRLLSRHLINLRVEQLFIFRCVVNMCVCYPYLSCRVPRLLSICGWEELKVKDVLLFCSVAGRWAWGILLWLFKKKKKTKKENTTKKPTW